MDSSKILNIVLAAALLVVVIIAAVHAPARAAEPQSIGSTLKTIQARTSIRNFTSQAVSREQLTTILRAGMAAPSAMNRQPWRFVAITNRATLDSLAAVLPYAKMLTTAQAAIIVCGDTQVSEKFWVHDCSAVSENILLAVTDLGLGAVWTAVYPDQARISAVKQVISMPDNILPLNVIPIGYPAAAATPKQKFDPAKIHWDRW